MPNIAIITGGRDYELKAGDIAWLDALLDEHKVDFILVGDCKTGVDAWVRRLYLDTHKRDGAVYYAAWRKWGNPAGPKRNEWMALFSSGQRVAFSREAVCIAFPGGKGTRSMVKAAEDYGIRVIRYAAHGDTVPGA